MARKSVASPKPNRRQLAALIGIDVGDLCLAPGQIPVLPQLTEYITDESELALLQAYRGLRKEWAREALRRRAVELLEEFGEKSVHNPWGKVAPTIARRQRD